MNQWTRQIVSSWFHPDFEKKYVSIDFVKLVSVAEDLAKQEMQVPDWKMPEVLPMDSKAFLSHLLYINAVNFAFTNFESPFEKFKVGNFSGSTAMTHCFYRKFGEKPIKYSEILQITDSLELTGKFFRGYTKMPLLDERRKNLREVALQLSGWFGDNVMNLLEESHWNAIEIIKNLKLYFWNSYGRDESNFWDGKRWWWLPFHKRPMLFAMMYHGRSSSDKNFPKLKNPEVIGPVSDYAVPNGLRGTGILVYDNALAEKIDAQTELSPNEREEIEIRTATVVVLNELLRRVNGKRPQNQQITMAELDYQIWTLGREISLKHHLTETTAY